MYGEITNWLSGIGTAKPSAILKASFRVRKYKIIKLLRKNVTSVAAGGVAPVAILLLFLMEKKIKYNVSFRIWLYSGENKFLGIGRVELLQRIKETGSIANAAKEMKMSYRQAWQMVSEMNERSNLPLVEKHLGGKSGGGAVVTEAGIRAIEVFQELENKVKRFIEEQASKLKL